MTQANLEFQAGNLTAAEQAARTASDMRKAGGVVDGNIPYMAQVFGLLGFEEDAIAMRDLHLELYGHEPTSVLTANGWVSVYCATGEFDKALHYLEILADEVEAGYRGGGRRIAENRFQYPEFEQPEFVELRRRLRYDIPGL